MSLDERDEVFDCICISTFQSNFTGIPTEFHYLLECLVLVCGTRAVAPHSPLRLAFAVFPTLIFIQFKINKMQNILLSFDSLFFFLSFRIMICRWVHCATCDGSQHSYRMHTVDSNGSGNDKIIIKKRLRHFDTPRLRTDLASVLFELCRCQRRQRIFSFATSANGEFSIQWRFAHTTLRVWFRRKTRKSEKKKKIIIFTDRYDEGISYWNCLSIFCP